MARENPGFRVQLEIILAAFPDYDCLSIQDVMRFTGLSEKQVRARYPTGWTGQRKAKRITRAKLAEVMTRI